LNLVKVSEIMSRPVLTVTPEPSIKEAARVLVENRISLPVPEPHGATPLEVRFTSP
jgi:CBS domain-containing protein